jgi:hypothetical protein
VGRNASAGTLAAASYARVAMAVIGRPWDRAACTGRYAPEAPEWIISTIMPGSRVSPSEIE